LSTAGPRGNAARHQGGNDYHDTEYSLQHENFSQFETALVTLPHPVQKLKCAAWKVYAMASVVSLGELLVDMVSEAPDASLQEAPRFMKAPGGAPANVAVGLARLGASASFVGQVGDDPFGEWLRNIIAAEGVDVSYLFRSRVARTTIAFVATRSDGRKDICFYRNPGADALLSEVELRPAMFDGTQIFHCGSVTLSQSPARDAQLRAAKMAIERDVLVSFDPNWRPSIWSDTEEAHALIWQMIGLSDIVKVADEEWEFVTGTSDFERAPQKSVLRGHVWS
jgi:fructokinase